MAPFVSEVESVPAPDIDQAAHHEANVKAWAEASNLFYMPEAELSAFRQALQVSGRMVEGRDPEFKAYAEEVGLTLNDRPEKFLAVQAEFEAKHRDPGAVAFDKLVNDTYSDIIKQIDRVLGGGVAIPEQRSTKEVTKKSSQDLINQAKADNPLSTFDKFVNKVIDVTKADNRTITKAVFDCYQALEARASKRDFQKLAQDDLGVINPDVLKQAVAYAQAGFNGEKIMKGVALTAAAAAVITSMAVAPGTHSENSNNNTVVASQLIGPKVLDKEKPQHPTEPLAPIIKKVVPHAVAKSPDVLAGNKAKQPVTPAERPNLVKQAQAYSKVLMHQGAVEASKVQPSKQDNKANVPVIQAVDGLIQDTIKQRVAAVKVALTPEEITAAAQHLANAQLAARYPAAVGEVTLSDDQLKTAQTLQAQLFSGSHDTYSAPEQTAVVSALVTAAEGIAGSQTPNSVTTYVDGLQAAEVGPVQSNGLSADQQKVITGEIAADRQAFFTMAVTEMNKLDDSVHVNKAIVLAQAALESRNGTSELTDLAQNYFGVKATPQSWSGPTVTIITHEYRHHRMVPERAVFRKYDSFAESLADYVKFVSRDRYADATNNYQDSDKYLEGLRTGGYFTDNKYAEKIASVMKTNHIDELYATHAPTIPTPPPVAAPPAETPPVAPEAPAPAPTPSPEQVTGGENTPAPANLSLEQQVDYLRSQMKVTPEGYKAFQINKQYMGVFNSELPGVTIKPTFMVMHWTGNNQQYKSIENFIGAIKNRKGGCCSVHRFIDRDGQVYQFMELNQMAAQARGYNETSVGTEIDATGTSDSIGGDEGYTPKQMEAMVYSTYQAQLEEGMPIGREGVKGHKEIDKFSGKIDGPKEVVDLIGEQISQLHQQLSNQ